MIRKKQEAVEYWVYVMVIQCGVEAVRVDEKNKERGSCCVVLFLVVVVSNAVVLTRCCRNNHVLFTLHSRSQVGQGSSGFRDGSIPNRVRWLCPYFASRIIKDQRDLVGKVNSSNKGQSRLHKSSNQARHLIAFHRSRCIDRTHLLGTNRSPPRPPFLRTHLRSQPRISPRLSIRRALP
jgi:hypothetical protein